MKSFLLRAAAICSPFVAAALLAVPAHAAPFVIYGPTPVQTFVNAPTEYTATFEGTTAVERCVLARVVGEGTINYAMTLTGSPTNGTAKGTATISTAGSHIMRVTCYNDTLGTSNSREATVAVYADASSPTVSPFTLTPPAPVAGASVTVQTNYDDTEFGSGLNTCGLIVDGVETGLMSLSAGVGSTIGTASITVTVATAGSHSLVVNCFDRSGNFGTRTQNVTFSAPADSTNPVVGGVTPTSATVGTSVSMNATFSDAVGVTQCQFVEGGTLLGTTSFPATNSGTASANYTFTVAGTHNIQAQCRDAAGNWGYGATTGITVSAAPAPDATNPVVSLILPTGAVRNSATTITASYSDNVGVTGCSLMVAGVNQGVMSLSGTQATKSHTFTSLGDHTVIVTCSDAAANVGNRSAIINVSAEAAADATNPVVGQIASITPTQNVGINITATYSDSVGVTACTLYVDGVNWGIMSLSGSTFGTASKTFAFNPAGTHTVYVTCADAVGNTGTGTSRTVTVTASTSADASAPAVGAVTPSTAVMNSSQTYYISYNDASLVNRCVLFVRQYSGTDNSYVMTRSGSTNGTASYAYTFSSAGAAGSYPMRAECTDEFGNTGTGPITNVSVSVPPSAYTPDTTGPSVSAVSPTRVMRESSTSFSVSFADAYPVTGCVLHVQQGSRYATYEMSRTGSNTGSASFSYTYYASVAPGSYTMYATCTDASGNIGTGPDTAISVGLTPITPPGGSYTRQLIKLICPGYMLDTNDPCKAVYYIGSDGKRHAFPNERAYFTWYNNFDNVYQLDTLASYVLGANVTYRPGIRLVKFTTVDRVYAVGRGGVLRWITSESAARAIYGDNWNRQVDDLSDAFYTNYRFGADINTAADFSPTAEAAAITSVDLNF